MNKGLAIALFASLAANIFLGGFVVGRLAGGPGHPRFDHPRHHAGPMMEPNLDALSSPGREAFHNVFEAERETLRERHRTLRERRTAFAAALTAEPFDRARAEAALNDLHAVTAEQQAAFAALMIDAVEELSDEDRKLLAKSIIDGSHWRSGKRRLHRRDKFPPPPDAEDAPPPPPAD
jgi:uncharacterized membrane protein